MLENRGTAVIREKRSMTQRIQRPIKERYDNFKAVIHGRDQNKAIKKVSQSEISEAV